ncbi:SmE [Symbiodinium sp. KB8]|nr:SmE [Symbiodinium sp. KB8]
MHPVPPPEVSYELHSWLVDLGSVKGRQGQNSKPHVLPGRLVANLVSGEAFVDLLNAIFSKHAVKQKLTSHAGQPQQTWTQVAKGLRRMSVELDNAALAALAGGDQALVLELLQELHVVYQHWISQEAKRQRRARNRRVQSQGQQNGYAASLAVDASEKRDAEKRDAAERRHAADRPKESAHTSRPPGKRSMPESADLPLPGSVDVHPDMGRLDTGKQHKPVREAEEEKQQIEQVADAPERKPWDALSSLSPDRDFSMASSAPELLGLSMMQQLRITPSQVQELLAENGRRLLRAFADVEHNVAHLSRWRMSQRSGAHGPAVSVMVSCCGDSLLQLTSQYLKQTVRGEQDPPVGPVGIRHVGALLIGLGDLLSALKTATQSRQGRCPHMVAFSCLARLLSRLCDNQDVEGTPAVYRTFVYALVWAESWPSAFTGSDRSVPTKVECESHSSREFGTRCLLNLLEKYEGVPVGILAELSVKKFQVSAAEPLTVIDIELFLVIAKHPRCTDRHAELCGFSANKSDDLKWAVLWRTLMLDVLQVCLPLLVIFRRFAREDSLQALFEHFVQADPTRDSEDAGQSGAKFNPQHDFVATISHLCCVCAYLGVPSLDRRMRRLLQEVCKAYLSSYIELHPNLQAVLQHYSQSATCNPVAHIGSLNDNSAANSAVGKKNAKDSVVDRLSSEMLLSKREVAAFRPDEGLILTVTLAITGGVKRFEENPDPNPLRNVSAPWPVGHGRGSGVVISLLETHSAVTEEVKSEIHELFSGVGAQSLSNVRHFDSYLSSLATALISLSEKVRGPYLQSPLSEILKVIDKTLKPGILDQHAAAQQAITRADQTVMRCYNTLWRSLNQSDVILHSLAEKRQAIKSCYTSAAADSAGVATALLSLPRLLTARASDCENLLAASNAREAPLQAWAASCDRHDGSSVGTYLMKQLMHWEDLLQHYDDIEKRCKESTASYETQVLRYNSLKSHQHDGADCRPLQVDMDEAACQQALDRIESCGTYGSCIKESIADRAVLHASQCKLEVNLKAQWYALESMKCLLKSYEDHGGSEDLLSKFAICKSRGPETYNLHFLSLQGCDDIKADVADALNSTHSSSKTSRACAITKDPQKDPSLPGTAAYEATYYSGFEPAKCTAKCCVRPPFTTTSTTTSTSSTSTTSTTSTTTTSTKSATACNATTVSMERSKNGTCTKLLDGRQRWVARLSPAPGTPEADLKEFGVALAIKSAKVTNTSKPQTPETEIPHVVMGKDRKLTLYLEHPGNCDEQRRVLQRVLPADRSIKLHRCKGSDDYYV